MANPKDWQERFLNALAGGDSVTAACKIAGISRTHVYRLYDENDEFADAWDDAIEAGTDGLEDEAVNRAKKGSDTLLIFLLKARRPDKFKDRKELSGSLDINKIEREVVDPKNQDP